MFKNNKGQTKRLCILLVLSLLFKTVPISPLGIGPVLGFVSGVYAQRALDRQCPGELELTIRKSYRYFKALVSQWAVVQDAGYFRQEPANLERIIKDNIELFTLAQENLRKHKLKVDERGFGSRDHGSIQQLKADNIDAHKLSRLAAEVYILAVEIAADKNTLKEIKKLAKL